LLVVGKIRPLKMNPERFPTTGAGEPVKVTLRLTRAELRALDRYCAKDPDPLPGFPRVARI
jgi:hypothetical protein